MDNLPAPNKGFDVVQDITEPRLRMYVTSRGAKTFFVRKRVHGKDKRIIIGNYPEIDIDTAREKVPMMLAEVVKKTPVRRRKISFKQFVDLYLENKIHRSEDSYVKLVRAINKHLESLFEKNINENQGYVKAMWCGDEECENKIKELTGAHSRCMPFEKEHVGDKCVCCGKPANTFIIWGRQY